MDTTSLAPYAKNLEAAKKEFEGYIAQGVKGIKVPATKADLQVGKKNFLTDSAWVFIIIGVIGFIAGLIVKISGIWITGCAAVACGVYCLIKGKQQLTHEAFAKAADGVYGALEGIVAHVSGGWTKNVEAENEALRDAIVGSAMADADKEKALANVHDTGFLHVDMDAIRAGLDKVVATDSIEKLGAYLPTAAKAITDSLDLAALARGEVYSLVTKLPNPEAPKPAPKQAAPQPAAPQPAPKPAAQPAPQPNAKPAADTPAK